MSLEMSRGTFAGMSTISHVEQRGRSVLRPAGTALVRRGFSMPDVVWLEKGRVTLGLLNARGQMQPLGRWVGPCWLNASCAVLEMPPVADVLADTLVRVRYVPLRLFLTELRAISAMAQSVLRDVARANREQMELILSRQVLDAEARCAEWLLRHARPEADGSLWVQLQERKRAIAVQLGIAPETLSRVLRQLRERNLLTGTGQRLGLPDPAGLRRLAGF